MREPVARQTWAWVAPLHTDYPQRNVFSYANFKIKIKAWVCPKLKVTHF